MPVTRSAPVVLNSQVVFHGAVFEVAKEEYELPGARKVVRDIVTHPGAAVFIPQQADGTLLLVRQYRYAIKDWLLEFPAGTLEPGEDALVCAKRELAEEVGRRAGEWIDLGCQYPGPGICSEKQYCFLARDLSVEAGELDQDEILEVETLSVPQVEQAIAQGRLCDAKSMAIFLAARLKGYL
jgi:ADP-ribose pyrophosphatase